MVGIILEVVVEVVVEVVIEILKVTVQAVRMYLAPLPRPFGVRRRIVRTPFWDFREMAQLTPNKWPVAPEILTFRGWANPCLRC